MIVAMAVHMSSAFTSGLPGVRRLTNCVHKNKMRGGIEVCRHTCIRSAGFAGVRVYAGIYALRMVAAARTSRSTSEPSQLKHVRAVTKLITSANFSSGMHEGNILDSHQHTHAHTHTGMHTNRHTDTQTHIHTHMEKACPRVSEGRIH